MDRALGLAWAEIPAGEFLRGSPDGEKGRLANEGPRRRVVISRGFLLARHETTVGQFRAFVAETGYRTEAERQGGGWGFDPRTGALAQHRGLSWRQPGFEQGDDHPVVQVSWKDAEAYCAWLTRRTGLLHRLPTEAEWEYACRGGTSTPFWSGADAGGMADVGNVADSALRDRCGWALWAHDGEDGFPFTAPVGSFAPNPFGLFDTHGNVWEWCEDWHDDDWYARSSAIDPTGPETGAFRAIRGGGWYDPPARSRAAVRVYFPPSFSSCQLSGFRVLREPAP